MSSYRCFQCDDEFIHKGELKFTWQEFCSMKCFINRWTGEQRYYEPYAEL